MRRFTTMALCAFLGSLASPPRAAAEPPAFNGVDSFITIYVYPPRGRIDWTSPKSALRGFFRNVFKAAIAKNDDVEFVSDFDEEERISSKLVSTMGHAMGHVRCRLPGGELYERWSSFSGQDMTAIDKLILLKEKIGLGTLFYDFLDGHIISGAGNLMRLTFYRGEKINGERNHPRYMQFELDPARCAETRDMISFFESFHFPKGTTYEELQRKHPEQILYFTNNLDPYDSYLARRARGSGKVGGGCAPYAVGLLRNAGNFRDALDRFWKRPVWVSEKLIGGIRDRHSGEVRRVSLRKLLFGSLGESWDYREEGYDNRKLSIYDPQKMWDFAGNVMECLGKTRLCRASTLELMKSEPGAFAKGQRRVFRADQLFDSPLASEAMSELFEDAALTEKARQMQQPVDGFVWRLPSRP